MNVDDIWASLKHVKPALVPHVHIQERDVRGERWAFLQNTISGQQLRLNSSGLQLMQRLDGQTSLEGLLANDQEAAASNEDTVDENRSQADVCSVIAIMSHGGMVSLGTGNETERLLQQYARADAVAWRKRWLNPLSLRFALHNPDGWLSRLQPCTTWLFTRITLYCVLSVLFLALITGLVNWQSISLALQQLGHSPQHWWLFLVMYPFMKALHELAHSMCIKHWGGSVHEVGITFLVLMPVPHVDASDASQFKERYQRMSVSGAGMLAEGFVAALSLLIWVVIEPGTLRDVAFAAAITGSVSTILFNANPLLKFDGYYLLEDATDIPNLASRSSHYYRYLTKRYLLSVRSAGSPVTAQGERRWFLVYGLLAYAYRWIITIAIALFLSSKYLIFGVILASFAFTHLLLKPVWNACRYLYTSEELDGTRARGVSTVVIVMTILIVAIVGLPLPSSTRAEGVVWVPTQAEVYAGESGRVVEVLASPGSQVKAGDVLVRLENSELRTRYAVALSQSDALQVAYRGARESDQVLAKQIQADSDALVLELAKLQLQLEQLVVKAPRDGRFSSDLSLPLAGRYIPQGSLLGYVVDPARLRVRAVISQRNLGLVQSGVVEANVRLADDISSRLSARLIHQTPAGDNRLPSPALAYNGHNGIAVASEEGDGLKTLERVFHVELSLPEHIRSAGIGGRAFVTLTHQPESLGRRWWRSVRQLLLKQLVV